MAFSTAGEIVNDAAVELGLITSDLSDPFTSTDANIIQLCRFLKSAGREIASSRQWTQAQNEYTFTTIAGVSTYALPADFLRMIPRTDWNRTNRLPLGGPLDPSEWQSLKGMLAGVVFTVLLRPRQGQLSVYPDTNTPGGYTLAFEYMSRYWVKPVGQTQATADKPTASSDTIYFDALMMASAIKRDFLKNKGFDYTATQDDFDRRLSLAMSNDAPTYTISLSRRPSGIRLLDADNLPLTGYGS